MGEFSPSNASHSICMGGTARAEACHNCSGALRARGFNNCGKSCNTRGVDTRVACMCGQLAVCTPNRAAFIGSMLILVQLKAHHQQPQFLAEHHHTAQPGQQRCCNNPKSIMGVQLATSSEPHLLRAPAPGRLPGGGPRRHSHAAACQGQTLLAPFMNPPQDHVNLRWVLNTANNNLFASHLRATLALLNDLLSWHCNIRWQHLHPHQLKKADTND